MGNQVCGINAALDEAKAAIDNLKAKIQEGVEGVGDLGSLAQTIKDKLSEINVPQVPSVNLQEELAKLPTLSPEEYAAAVADIKAKFGSAVPNLDDVIAKIPKPFGVEGTDQKDIFAELRAAVDGFGAAFKDAQEAINNISIEAAVADICKEVPNVEVTTTTKEEVRVNPTTQREEVVEVVVVSPPVEKPKPPVTPKEDPKPDPVPVPTPPPANGFTFKFTKDKLAQATSAKAAEWYDAMNTVLPKYGITTPERVSVFLGQIVAEAGANLNQLKESSKYSPKAYFSICQKRLGLKSVDECSPYLATPEKTFQGLYEATLDGTFHYKGKELNTSAIQVGDGARFCGRGLKQLTGRGNYTRASKEIYGDDRLVKNPDLVSNDKEVALETACWFWKSRNLNALADQFDIVAVTKKVNGGDLGLKTRQEYAERALKVFKA
jgi:putative chitinase